MNKASIGRIVHTWDGENCSAAMVTDVDSEGAGLVINSVSVAVFTPNGLQFMDVPYSEDKKEDTWHWPERVE